jgi:hypothetical protein
LSSPVPVVNKKSSSSKFWFRQRLIIEFAKALKLLRPTNMVVYPSLLQGKCWWGRQNFKIIWFYNLMSKVWQRLEYLIEKIICRRVNIEWEKIG